MGDIAVIGAGPAGCASAITLAAAGHRVSLFERGEPGKDKACGDALLPQAVSELNALGLPTDRFSADGGSPFGRLDLWDDRGCIWTVPLGAEVGWVARRAFIDQALRDIAARTVCLTYRARVRSIDYADGQWHITGTGPSAGFDAVVLATGATNALSRSFGIDGRPRVGASVSAYGVHVGVEAPLFQFAPLGGAGYGWIFPLADGRVNLGVCAVEPGPKHLRAAMGSYMRLWAIPETGPIRGGGGPFWSGEGTKWHDTRGLVSCGDAAGLVDPLTGEGIAAALESGRVAGAAVAAWLQQGRMAQPLTIYSAWVLSTFRSRYSRTAARRAWDYLSEASGR
jgi:flavin-dependent dehydrogenase